MGVSSYFLSLPFVQKPMHMSTPRKVYWFFFLSNKAAFGLSLLGYVLVLLDALSGKVWGLGPTAVLLLFYGLLYGVIARDLASLCADKMARTLGFSGDHGAMPDRTAVSGRVCAICADTLQTATEDLIALPSCGHEFHSFSFGAGASWARTSVRSAGKRWSWDTSLCSRGRSKASSGRTFWT